MLFPLLPLDKRTITNSSIIANAYNTQRVNTLTTSNHLTLIHAL